MTYLGRTPTTMHNCRKASDIIAGVISNRQEAEQCHLLSEIIWFIRQLACVSECHSHVYPSLEMNKYEQHKFEESFRIPRKIHQPSQVRGVAQKGQMHFRVFNRVGAVLPPRSMGSIVVRYWLKKNTRNIPPLKIKKMWFPQVFQSKYSKAHHHKVKNHEFQSVHVFSSTLIC